MFGRLILGLGSPLDRVCGDRCLWLDGRRRVPPLTPSDSPAAGFWDALGHQGRISFTQLSYIFHGRRPPGTQGFSPENDRNRFFRGVSCPRGRGQPRIHVRGDTLMGNGTKSSPSRLLVLLIRLPLLAPRLFVGA